MSVILVFFSALLVLSTCLLALQVGEFPPEQVRFIDQKAKDGFISSSASIPVIQSKLTKLHFKPEIDLILAQSLDSHRFLDYATTLTGERLSHQAAPHQAGDRHHPSPGWVTRNSFSNGALLAVQWLKSQFESNGANQCQLDYYLDHLAPNLICVYHQVSLEGQFEKKTDDDDDQPNRSIVLTAHYDSRSTFGSVLAPGGDNDASGCVLLLSISHSLNHHLRNQNQTLINQETRKDQDGKGNSKESGKGRDVYFVLFSGFEQGRLGSNSLAHRWIRQMDILVMVNVDMISYRVPGEVIQLGLQIHNPDSINHLAKNQANKGDPHGSQGLKAVLLKYFASIGNLYCPQVLIGQNSVVDESDEIEFDRLGILTLRLFERVDGKTKNPHHLKSSDKFLVDEREEGQGNRNMDEKEEGLTSGYDIGQSTLIGKILLGFVLDLIS